MNLDYINNFKILKICKIHGYNILARFVLTAQKSSFNKSTIPMDSGFLLSKIENKGGVKMELKKLLREPNSFQHIFEFQSIQYQTEQSLAQVYRNRYSSPGKPLPNQITSVLINGHTVQRWNERVGPSLDKEQLEELFNDLIKIPYRITTLSDDIAVIDDEIVFIYKFNEDQLVILTIYGRISLKPSLQSLNELRRFNYQQYDRLNLSISRDVLERQFPPPVPKNAYYFKGNHTTYRLETYECENRNQKIFLTTYSIDGNQRMKEIMLDVPQQAKLSNKVLYVLYELGYHEFVYNHMKYHKPHKFEQTEQKIAKESSKIGEQKLLTVS